MSAAPRKPLVGISSCLLGEQVRYDGGHKYDWLINTQLAGLFEYLPCCPEVAIGLGIPREPIRLIRTDHGIRVRGVDTPDIDVTRRLTVCGNRLASEYEDICGYIFKARSPSCGIGGVATWTEQGSPAASDGSGAFAAALLRAHPGLPVTDETRLRDPLTREQFIERVLEHYRNHPRAAPRK